MATQTSGGFSLPGLMEDTSPPAAEAARRGDVDARSADADRKTIAFLTFQFFSLIYFQKLGVPVSGSQQVGAPMVIFFIMLVPALASGAIQIDRLKFEIFLLLGAVAVTAQYGVPHFSLARLALFLALHAAMTLGWNLDRTNYVQVCKRFSLMMILPTIFVFAQYAYELHAGDGNSLSLEPFIPGPLLLKGYIYEPSTVNWVVWNRPNGLVFLEPSFCSALLACAFVTEIHVLRRYGRAAFFAMGLVATNGGTGTLLAFVGLLAAALLRRPMTTIAAGLLTVMVVAASSVSLQDLPLLSRQAELGDTASSGYGRLLLPIEVLATRATDFQYMLSGSGAGQITEDIDGGGSPWPVAKMVYEYGILTGLIYFIFICVCMAGTTNIPLRLGLFVIYQFTGGYLLSPFIIILVFLTCFGRVTPDVSDGQNGARNLFQEASK